jgi:hypothetical protein
MGAVSSTKNKNALHRVLSFPFIAKGHLYKGYRTEKHKRKKRLFTEKGFFTNRFIEVH